MALAYYYQLTVHKKVLECREKKIVLAVLMKPWLESLKCGKMFKFNFIA